MTVEGIDYSTGRPTEAHMNAAGVRFVARYASDPGNPKNITAAEAAWHRGAGRDIVIVYERTARRALGGSALGYHDAESGSLQTIGAGGPHDAVLYLAADWDVSPAEVPPVLDYLRGAGAALNIERVGVYGGRRIIAAAKAAGVAGYFWQTLAWSWNSQRHETDWVPGVHIQQYAIDKPIRPGGANVDFNRAMTADFGQWEGQGGILAGMSREDLTTLVRDAVQAELRERRIPTVDTPVEAFEKIRTILAAASAGNLAAAAALASSQRDELRSVDIKRRLAAIARALQLVAARVGADLSGIDLDFPDEVPS